MKVGDKTLDFRPDDKAFYLHEAPNGAGWYFDPFGKNKAPDAPEGPGWLSRNLGPEAWKAAGQNIVQGVQNISDTAIQEPLSRLAHGAGIMNDRVYNAKMADIEARRQQGQQLAQAGGWQAKANQLVGEAIPTTAMIFAGQPEAVAAGSANIPLSSSPWLLKAGSKLPLLAGRVGTAGIAGMGQALASTPGGLRERAEAANVAGVIAPVFQLGGEGVVKVATPLVGKAVGIAKGIMKPKAARVIAEMEAAGVTPKPSIVMAASKEAPLEVQQAEKATKAFVAKLDQEMADTPFKGLAEIKAIADKPGRRQGAAKAMLEEINGLGSEAKDIVQTSAGLSALREKIRMDKLASYRDSMAGTLQNVEAPKTVAAIDQSIKQLQLDQLKPHDAEIKALEAFKERLARPLDGAMLAQEAQNVGASGSGISSQAAKIGLPESSANRAIRTTRINTLDAGDINGASIGNFQGASPTGKVKLPNGVDAEVYNVDNHIMLIARKGNSSARITGTVDGNNVLGGTLTKYGKELDGVSIGKALTEALAREAAKINPGVANGEFLSVAGGTAENATGIKKVLDKYASTLWGDEGKVSILNQDLVGGNRQTFQTLSATRSSLGKEISKSYRGGQAVTGDLDATILQPIKNALTDDLSDAAQKSGIPELAAADKLFRREYSRYHGTYKDPSIVKLIESKDPDKMMEAFSRAGVPKAQRLFNALDPKGQAAAARGVVGEAFANAVNKRTGDFIPGNISGGIDDKLEALGVTLKGENKFKLDGLKNVMQHLAKSEPTQASALRQGVTDSAVKAGEKLWSPIGLYNVIKKHGVDILFDSPAGRRILFAASTAKPGSARMNAIISANVGNLAAKSTSNEVKE